MGIIWIVRDFFCTQIIDLKAVIARSNLLQFCLSALKKLTNDLKLDILYLKTGNPLIFKIVFQ